MADTPAISADEVCDRITQVQRGQIQREAGLNWSSSPQTISICCAIISRLVIPASVMISPPPKSRTIWPLIALP